MSTLQTKSLRLVVLLLLSLVSCGTPSLPDCPPTHPIKCPPYNQCCAMHEFCHQNQRECVSCFPSKIRTRQQQLQFCQGHQFEASQKMLDPSCVGACDAMFGRETFFSLTCNATHPIGCSLYGKCCAMYSFCNDTLKDCDSCFPKDYDTDERQLQFCREFPFKAASKMRHPSCVGACEAKFGREKLFSLTCNATHPIGCSLYGKCCAMYSFCNDTLKDCDSCFPKDYDTDERQLQFCREFPFKAASKMRHPSCVGACEAKFGREKLFSLTCNATHPIGCSLYGKCCAMYSFCNDTLKDCDSCFPKDYDTDERQLQFCREFPFKAASKMRHPSCVGACEAKFGRDKLFSLTCNATHPIGYSLYGKCCAMYSFCNDTLKDCDSCFPKDYDTDERQLQFCKEFPFEAASKMRHPSCVGACDAKFGREKLFGALQTISWPTDKIVIILQAVIILVAAVVFLVLVFKRRQCCTLRKGTDNNRKNKEGGSTQEMQQMIEGEDATGDGANATGDGQQKEKERNNRMDDEAEGDENVNGAKPDQMQKTLDQMQQQMMTGFEKILQEQKRSNRIYVEASGDENINGEPDQMQKTLDQMQQQMMTGFEKILQEQKRINRIYVEARGDENINGEPIEGEDATGDGANATGDGQQKEKERINRIYVEARGDENINGEPDPMQEIKEQNLTISHMDINRPSAKWNRRRKNDGKKLE